MRHVYFFRGADDGPVILHRLNSEARLILLKIKLPIEASSVYAYGTLVCKKPAEPTGVDGRSTVFRIHALCAKELKGQAKAVVAAAGAVSSLATVTLDHFTPRAVTSAIIERAGAT